MDSTANTPRDSVEAEGKERWITPVIQSLNANEAAVPKLDFPEGGGGSILPPV